MKSALFSLALVCVLGVPAHTEDPSAADASGPLPARHYTVPENTSDGWETASVQSVGLEPALINDLLASVVNGTYKNIHSMLVVKDGKLVFEEYFPGQDDKGNDQDFNRDTLHTQQSVTKSVNSLLLGIAIDQHLIPGVEEKISTYFPEDADLFQDSVKGALRLKHFLSMTGGLAWKESGIPYTDPRNDAYGLNRSANPFRYVLDRPMAEPPGQKFLYNSGIAIALGEVLKRATGQPADQFAERNLFGPLGITHFFWGKLSTGAVHTGGGLFLRPRDMVKIGLLCLNGGRWQGKQIVSENWIRESTKQQAPYRGYGYQWWLRTLRLRDRATEVYAAQGRGGQFIVVIPELQMVAAFTSWNLNELVEQPFDMLQQYIIPAAEAAHANRHE